MLLPLFSINTPKPQPFPLGDRPINPPLFLPPQIMRDADRGSTAVGLCLLPSELLHEIFFRLALPELLRVRSVSKALASLVSAHDFRRLYDLRSDRGGGWLFIYKKRPPRDSVLRGFNDRFGRWFKIPVVSAAVAPGEDLYFLAASGGVFLFASNSRRELVAVNIATRSVRRIPPSPMGPRGTASWRRSGLKLVADPSGVDHFRFLFAEMVHNRSVLFEYRSETDSWRAVEAEPEPTGAGSTGIGSRRDVCLNVVQLGLESVVLSCGGGGEEGPAVVLAHRPRFPAGFQGGPPVGFNTSDRFHVYGDGNVAVVRSSVSETAGGGGTTRTRVVTGVELLGLSGDGTEWELTSSAPAAIVEALRWRPYTAMMGCLVEREGVVRMALMSNCRGCWDLAWLSYHRAQGKWACVPVPDCGTTGLNMAGIALSSTFSRSLWSSLSAA
ncbi:uncharacterized protein LOC121981891 [Zingiber officinale]|uniref:F-box domain-containing protein n=1 Tax=Zingiber officinale TaxID=94328 RepID=A0A8J5L763_ZINOF|nr:uncharacterized protein LOC121981891 [Zingiber officinale]KAG6508478.1 hypothetical protein ZIOFF_033852 [Zingiber officinale]